MPTPTPIRTALTLGLTASGAFAGIGLALSIGTIPLLLLAPAPTLLKQWRAMYDMGLWIGPPGAVLAAASLGYSAYAIYRHEKTYGDDTREEERRSLAEISDTKEGGKERAGEEEGKWKPIALAAATCVAIVPFTWAFLVGTSEVLLRESEGGFGAGMKEKVLRDTVVKWGWICAARALLPLVGTAVGVWSVLGGLGIRAGRGREVDIDASMMHKRV